MLSSLKLKLSNFWNEAKAFFKYSETILIARAQVFSGFILAVATNVDWTALSDFVSYKQSIALAGGLILNGILTEWARRRNSDL